MKPIALIAAVAFVLVGATLDDPGLTIDEGLNVRPGVVLLRMEAAVGLAALSPSQQSELFGQIAHDYPPLGRVWLGLHHELVTTFREPDTLDSPGGIDVIAARWGSATAFGLTILLVGGFARRWSGDVAGIAAAVAMATTPRLFGHAHFASIETILNLVYAGCVLVAADRLAVNATPKRAAACGALWGLVLLTKIQAVLIPIPLAAWMFFRHGNRAWKPLAIYAVTGLAVFFIGWPWLWGGPIDRTLAYFGGDGRVTLFTHYFGQTYADHDVPWHYPFVMFALTQPVAWLAMGVWGSVAAGRTRGPRLLLVLAAAAFPLLFFAVPGITVYDGVRLFLVSYPLWAVLVGVGADAAWTRLSRSPRLATLRTPLAVAATLPPLVQFLWLAPGWLSHYAIGTGPAESLGMETTYWGDSITDDLWADLTTDRHPGHVFAVAPTLHPFQLTEQSYHLPSRGYTLVAWDQTDAAPPGEAASQPTDLVIFARRSALAPDSLPRRLLDVPVGDSLEGWTVRRIIERQGSTLTVHATRD